MTIAKVRAGKVNLNSGQVWKHCCLKYSDPYKELWIPDDLGRCGIYCIEHPEVLLGFEDDLPEK